MGDMKKGPKTEGQRLLDEWMDEPDGPTPTQLAEGLGVSRAAIHSFREGDYRPRIDIRERLALFSAGRISSDSWLTEAERDERDAVKPFVRDAAPGTR